ncbi:MAG: hypothetical protein LC104_05970 [Bacteroidales bacterium]|nr:hypothetical protein [Bacteroidales bacterium]
MNQENFLAVLESHRSQRPFRGFTVELVNGQKIEVDHPGAFFARDGVCVFLAPGGIPHWFDHENVLQIISQSANANP